MPTSDPECPCRCTVLLIERTDGLAFALRSVLECDGYTVRIAGTLDEGIARLREEEFGVVLLGGAPPHGGAAAMVSAVQSACAGARVLVLGDNVGFGGPARGGRGGRPARPAAAHGPGPTPPDAPSTANPAARWLAHPYGMRDVLSCVRAALAAEHHAPPRAPAR